MPDILGLLVAVALLIVRAHCNKISFIEVGLFSSTDSACSAKLPYSIGRVPLSSSTLCNEDAPNLGKCTKGSSTNFYGKSYCVTTTLDETSRNSTNKEMALPRTFAGGQSGANEYTSKLVAASQYEDTKCTRDLLVVTFFFADGKCHAMNETHAQKAQCIVPGNGAPGSAPGSVTISICSAKCDKCRTDTQAFTGKCDNGFQFECIDRRALNAAISSRRPPMPLLLLPIVSMAFMVGT